ncbi:zinc finger protein 775-like, partial [Homalodisca vitripennis]|uniref:zinc finger protein 775-like n=1 Tax=Homalodisca vitripennis TaxID=197043 RepID=UPI001EEC60B4
ILSTGALLRPFCCPDCGRSYSRKDNLTRHKKLECGNDPQYPCRHCPYRAKRKNHLLNHMVLRHPATIPDQQPLL